MSSRKPQKSQAEISCSQKTSETHNTSNASSVAASLATSSTATPTSSKPKRTRKTPDSFGSESSVCSVSDNDSMPAQKRQRPVNPVIETIIQEEALQPPAVETSFELPIVSPPVPQAIGTWSPDEYYYADYEREVSISVFGAENQI